MKIVLPSEKGGSHQHYWHLLLGNVLPLFYYIKTLSELNDIAIFDPGPLKHVLTDLGIRVLDIESYLELTSELANIKNMHKRGSRNYKFYFNYFSRSLHLIGLKDTLFYEPAIAHVNQQMYSHIPAGSLIPTRQSDTQCIRLKGFDHPTNWKREEIRSATEKLVSYMDVEENVLKESNNNHLIFVNRGQAHEFYYTRHAHGIESGTGIGHTSGTQRRSIPNSDEIISAIGNYWEIQEVLLEEISFKRQIEIFRNAETIICQTGAGLANLVWSKPGTTLIEISPSSSDSAKWIAPMIEKLELNYHIVHQIGDHGIVPAKAIIELLTKTHGHKT